MLILYLYFTIHIYTPIKIVDTTYYINLSNPRELYFKTPTLMIDEFIDSKIKIKIQLENSFKNNIKNEKYYTLVIEKDKSLIVQITPEYIKDMDFENNSRENKYYYLVQEYSNQDELVFELKFSCDNKINMNEYCTFYLEYGDIHEKINDEFDSNNLKNKFFDKSIFITDYSSFNNK